MELYRRTCQSCGLTAFYDPPKDRHNTTTTFENKKCIKCKSESLDLGSEVIVEPYAEQEKKAIELELKELEE